LLLQFLQLLFKKWQARDRGAIGLVGDRVFLHLRPTRIGIPLIPGMFGVGIVRCLRHQIIERTMIILQIEDAIALLKIEIRSVQLIAMAQAGGKVSPHQLCLPDLCLDVIERFGILRAQRSHSYQDKRNSQQTCPHHFRLRRESPNGDEFYTIR